MPERASLDELKDFANRVREAGGGNAIHALIPSVPQDATQCLIARNLNFNCSVLGHPMKDDHWVMNVEDEATRDRIAAQLGLEKGPDGSDVDYVDGRPVLTPLYSVVLPPEIGQVAADFDEAMEDMDAVLWDDIGLSAYEVYNEEAKTYEYKLPEGFDFEAEARKALENIDDGRLKRFKEFSPYIELSNEYARKLARIVNEDGSVVL